MTIIEFIWFFLITTIFGTLAVTGWFFITRGDIIILPDGSEKRVGKIFKGWYFFWTKEKGKRKVFYNYDQLNILCTELSSNYPAIMFGLGGNLLTLTYKDLSIINEIEKKWDVKFHIRKETENVTDFMVYKEYPDYVFPEWVRSPLATCATCFSSIYGSIYYWGFVALIRENLFAWSNIPWLAALFFWGVFCFSLSVLNTALAKRFN